MNRTAAEGFTRPDVYEQGRPGYPQEAVEVLELREGVRVADLGCGTGKFTRQLGSTDATIVGIEPLPAMAGAFHELLPDVDLLIGVAEAIPLRDASVDLVTCASAFHWFDHDRAIPEIHRVLKPTGRLAIVWNRRDRLTGWAHEFWQITEQHRGTTPGYRTGAWRDALTSSGLFGPITGHRFHHVQHTDVDGLLARIASISFIETLPEATKSQVLADARRFVETHPETATKTSFDLPYHSVVYIVERGAA